MDREKLFEDFFYAVKKNQSNYVAKAKRIQAF